MEKSERIMPKRSETRIPAADVRTRCMTISTCEWGVKVSPLYSCPRMNATKIDGNCFLVRSPISKLHSRARDVQQFAVCV